MSCYIRFIVDHASLVLSCVVAIATIAYTWINYLMYKESKITRRQKLRPEIVPYLQSNASNTILCLHIKNVGEGCAKNVRVNLINDYNCLGKTDWPLSKFPLFNEGISVYPPGYELHFYIDYWDTISSNGLNGYIEMAISYTDVKGEQADCNHYKLNFNHIMSNYSTPPDTYEAQIPYYLEQISKAIKKNT